MLILTWVVNNGAYTGKGCRCSNIWESSVSIDKLRISLCLTLVETAHMGVAISGTSIPIGRMGIESVIGTIVGTVTIIWVRVSVVGTIEVSWVGFRLSLSNSCKGDSENSDLKNKICKLGQVSNYRNNLNAILNENTSWTIGMISFPTPILKFFWLESWNHWIQRNFG